MLTKRHYNRLFDAAPEEIKWCVPAILARCSPFVLEWILTAPHDDVCHAMRKEVRPPMSRIIRDYLPFSVKDLLDLIDVVKEPTDSFVAASQYAKDYWYFYPMFAVPQLTRGQTSLLRGAAPSTQRILMWDLSPLTGLKGLHWQELDRVVKDLQDSYINFRTALETNV